MREEVQRSNKTPAPVALSPQYLAAVRAVEEHPRNCNGADKSWVWEAAEQDRLYFLKVKRVR